MEEDRETQKISLNYALNYAPGAASDVSFCEAHVLWLDILLDEDRESQKIPMN